VEEPERETIPWDREKSDDTLVELPDEQKDPEKDGLVCADKARLRFANCEMNKEATEKSSDPKANRKRNHFPEFATPKTRKGIEAARVCVPRNIIQHRGARFLSGLFIRRVMQVCGFLESWERRESFCECLWEWG
jgi:hypothetical protein